jgi:DNA replication protein DnaC
MWSSTLLDALGYISLKPEQVHTFFKLLDQRYARASTLITSDLAYEAWYALFQRKCLVDAMLDRLQHHCITIHIDAPSLRAPERSPSSYRPPAAMRADNAKPDWV